MNNQKKEGGRDSQMEIERICEEKARRENGTKELKYDPTDFKK